MPSLENAPQILLSIIEHFTPNLNGAAVEVVAGKLNAIDGSATWSRRYVLSVANGTLKPSRRLARAIAALAATLDDVPVELARAETIEISAAPGAIRKGAYVLGTSKVCERPGCGVIFVPNVPWRRYCGMCR